METTDLGTRHRTGSAGASPRPSILPLECSGPHPDIPAIDRIFQPLIGSWDLEVTWYQDGVLTRREAGEWHFAWVLEGRAIQDVWIVPPRKEREQPAGGLYEYGTSIRFYDRGAGLWRSTWIGPTRELVRMFIARSDPAGGIVLESSDSADGKLRWMFSDITDAGFRWQNFEDHGDGTFLLVQEFFATRAHSLD